MNQQNLVHLILEYRYWIMIPLSLIEGPVVAFVCGTLAAAGYFNIFFLGIYFFARDMIMDGIFYAFGYFGNRFTIVQKLLKRFDISENDLNKVRQIWETYPARTMFIGKLSYGLAAMFIAVAGTVRMQLKKFFGYGALVAISQYWTLLCLGYFFGQSLGSKTTNIIEFVQYLIAGASFFVTLYYLFVWYLRKKYRDRIVKRY
jgi:membrane protein DedA with SNARE-associated domain